MTSGLPTARTCSCSTSRGRYPVAYFPIDDIRDGVLNAEDRVTRHGDLGEMQWYTLVAGGREVPHAAWQHTTLPSYATDLTRRVAFGWRAVDVFYEEENASSARRAVRVGLRPALVCDRDDIDDQKLHSEPGQTVVAHGIDRGLDPEEVLQNAARSAW